MPAFMTQISRLPDTHTALLEMSDEELMAQFQAGTLRAFDLLVARYTDPLRHYLYGFTKSWSDVDDLLQETFMRVHRNRHGYNRVARFSTWIYTIAGNLARSSYRKKLRRQTYSMQSLTRDGEEYEYDVPDEEQRDTDQVAESTIQQHYIHRALNSVSSAFREVVVLRDVQELPYEQIAAITGLPMGTVKSRINRGRRKLQSLLQDVYPDVAATA